MPPTQLLALLLAFAGAVLLVATWKQVLTLLLTALLTLLVYPVDAAYFLLRHKRLIPRPRASFEERIDSIAARLQSSATDADDLVRELDQLVQARRDTLRAVEAAIADLQERERDATARIEALEATDPEVAKYFAELTRKDAEPLTAQNKRYFLVGLAGAFIGIAISILQLGGC